MAQTPQSEETGGAGADDRPRGRETARFVRELDHDSPAHLCRGRVLVESGAAASRWKSTSEHSAARQRRPLNGPRWTWRT